MGMPQSEDIEDFLSKVDDVGAKLAALQDGTLDVEEFDRQQELEDRIQKREEDEARAKEEKRQEASANYEERKQKAQVKVDEILARKQKKETARKKFEKYQNQQKKHKGEQALKSSTDYNAWDLWCPSDDEDDMIKTLPPSGEQFRAMERDIDERHARMKRKEKVAAKCKEAGNRAYKAGQYAEAYKNYEEGLENEKKNIEMQCNAAMASIKMGCAVQAVEHCDQVMRLADFFLEKPNHPMVFKGLQRRATAYSMLKRFAKAVEDLERALTFEPENRELKRQYNKAKKDLDEQVKEKALRKAHRVATSDSSADAVTETSEDMKGLSTVEKLTQIVKPKVASKWKVEVLNKDESEDADVEEDKDSEKENEVPSVKSRTEEILRALIELDVLLKEKEDLRTYIRSCGGLKALTDHLIGKELDIRQVRDSSSGGSEAAILLVPVLKVLLTACLNDFNQEEALKDHEVLKTIITLLTHSDKTVVRNVTALLSTCTPTDVTRKALALELKRQVPAVNALVALLSSADAVDQANAIALVGNCALEANMRSALKDVGNDDGATFIHTVVKLLDSKLHPIVERAANLLANLCGDSTLQKRIVEGSSAVKMLVKALPSPPAPPTPKGLGLGLGNTKKKAPESSEAPAAASAPALSPETLEMQASILAALANCVLSNPTCTEIITNEEGVPKLVGSLESGAGNVRVLGRASLILSRLAKHLPALKQMRVYGGIAALVNTANTARTWKAIAPSDDPQQVQQEDEFRVQALEGATRALAVIVNVAGEMGQDVGDAGGLKVLLEVAEDSKSTDQLVGNAALCVGDCAKLDGVLEMLRKLDAVGKLIPVAHKRKGTAQKNAAIALARMSRHPPLLERLRELHGIEIMHSYVKM